MRRFKEASEFKELKTDIVVVGGGIMGSTIGEAFRNKGREVIILDDGKPLSGTSACGGCIKISPLMGLNKDDEKPILDLMESLFGIHKERFQIRPSMGLLKADVWQIEMDRVYKTYKTLGEVFKLKTSPKYYVYYRDSSKEVTRLECEILVIASGMGCSNILPSIISNKELTAKKGVTFRFKGKIEKPFVKAWAPYKQVTVHNIVLNGENKIWSGDGSALKPENWGSERTSEALVRIKKAMDIEDEPVDIIYGLRPFHSSHMKPCYLKKIDRHFWVATGAGKFGCISAGWAAKEIMKDEL